MSFIAELKRRNVIRSCSPHATGSLTSFAVGSKQPHGWSSLPSG